MSVPAFFKYSQTYFRKDHFPRFQARKKRSPGGMNREKGPFPILPHFPIIHDSQNSFITHLTDIFQQKVQKRPCLFLEPLFRPELTAQRDERREEC